MIIGNQHAEDLRRTCDALEAEIAALKHDLAEYMRIANYEASENDRLKKALRVAAMALAHATQEHGKVYRPAYVVVDAALSGEGK